MEQGDLLLPVAEQRLAEGNGAAAYTDGDAPAARGALRRAWQGWQAVEVSYLAARVRVLMGLAGRALGDEDGGGLELDAARAVFVQLGAAPDLARVDSLIQRPPSGPLQRLTPRELQVLRLVATGRTKRFILSP